MGKIKGWTKVDGGVITIPPTIRWENKKEYLTLHISEWRQGVTNKVGYDVLVNYYNPIKRVHRRIMFNGADRKTFKTKKQALDFAMNYMRSHPNG